MTNITEIAQIIITNYVFNLALLLTILVVAAYLLKFILIWFFDKYLQKASLLPEKFSFQKHFSSVIWLLSLLIGFNMFHPLLETPEKYATIIDKTWQIAFIAVTTFFFIKLTRFLKIIIVKRYDMSVKNNLNQRKVLTQLNIAEKIIVVSLVILGFSTILLSFEAAKKLGTSLIASAGLAGIVMGFAAQKTLSNLIAGFQIAITQPFRIDDVVIVEGEWGWIEEITLTYVVVRIWDKRRLILPINYILEKPFENWTRNDSELLGYVYIYADYTLPLDELKKEFHRLLGTTDLWNQKVATVQVTNSTEKTQEIRFLVSAEDSGTAWNLRCFLRENLINYIQKNFPESLPKYRLESPHLQSIISNR